MMATVLSTEMTFDDLVRQAGDALVSGSIQCMRTADDALMSAKRELNLRDPAQREQCGVLYTQIGLLRDSMNNTERREREHKVDRLIQRAQDALEANEMGPLLRVKQELKNAIDDPVMQRCQGRLREQVKRVNTALDALNDVQAVALINEFNVCVARARDAVKGKNFSVASSCFSTLVLVAEQITRPKPFMRYAIERVEEDGWKSLCSQVDRSLGSANGMISDLGVEVGTEYKVRAKAFATRLEANLANGNTGAAEQALREFQKAENRAGLAVHLGSIAACSEFLQEMEERLAGPRAKRWEKTLKSIARLTG